MDLLDDRVLSVGLVRAGRGARADRAGAGAGASAPTSRCDALRTSQVHGATGPLEFGHLGGGRSGGTGRVAPAAAARPVLVTGDTEAVNTGEIAARLGAEQRAAFRRFVREHHPDRGGDPAVFAAGVRAFRSGRAGASGRIVVDIHRSPHGVGHLTHWVRHRWAIHTRPPRVR